MDRDRPAGTGPPGTHGISPQSQGNHQTRRLRYTLEGGSASVGTTITRWRLGRPQLSRDHLGGRREVDLSEGTLATQKVERSRLDRWLRHAIGATVKDYFTSRSAKGYLYVSPLLAASPAMMQKTRLTMNSTGKMKNPIRTADKTLAAT